MKSILAALIAAAFLAAGAPAAAQPADANASYLVLVSIDGFRHDYLERHDVPALAALAAGGLRARSLRPVWPTLTFPNHYSIATGLYPAEHGIVGNRFPSPDRERWYEYRDRAAVQDGSWYAGEPIWVAAERAGLGSAAFYFVGTEAPVGGVSPGDWRAFDASVPGEARVAQVIDWLARPEPGRPNVDTLYFEHVDVASNRFGPGSPEAVAAIRQVDAWIGALVEGLAGSAVAGDVYVIVVSDHGQIATRTDAPVLVLEDLVDLSGIDVVDHGSVSMLYLPRPDAVRAARIRDAINAHWEHGRAWLRDEAPAYWQVAGSPRVADVLVQSDPGYANVPQSEDRRQVTVGDHGWSPGAVDMHGIFIARGPRLPDGRVIPTIDAVDVYPLMLEILGLPDRRAVRRESPLPALLE